MMAQGEALAPGGEASPFPDGFAFATGIEGSDPVVTGRDGRDRRIDEMASCFHDLRWREDLQLVHDLGIRYLRYGPPYHRTHLGEGRYDFDLTDQTLPAMRELGIEPILDLCHFGVPDWIGSFQEPRWPELFATYAGAVADRYPWIRLWTPVNDIYVAAKMSALHGAWNERRSDERSFVTALKHLVRADLLATRTLADRNPDAWFIGSESAEHFHPGGGDPTCAAVADFENQRRFLSCDLRYGHPVRGDVRAYLRDNGLTDEEHAWFLRPRPRDHLVLGLDFYRRNEQLVMPGGAIEPSGDIFGWYPIARQYHRRYGLPLMHTETNAIGGGEREAPAWLWRQYLSVQLLREEGVPVLGFTWYSLTDQLDWDTGLVDDRGMVNPIGLYDLDRRERPVGAAYRQLIAAARSTGSMREGLTAGTPPA